MSVLLIISADFGAHYSLPHHYYCIWWGCMLLAGRRSCIINSASEAVYIDGSCIRSHRLISPPSGVVHWKEGSVVIPCWRWSFGSTHHSALPDIHHVAQWYISIVYRSPSSNATLARLEYGLVVCHWYIATNASIVGGHSSDALGNNDRQMSNNHSMLRSYLPLSSQVC